MPLKINVREGRVVSTDIGTKTVGSQHLALDAVGSSELVGDNTIGSAQLINNTVGYGELTTGLQGTYMPKSGGTFTGSVDYSGSGKPPRLAILTPGGAIVPATLGALGTAGHGNFSWYEQRFSPGTSNSVFWEFQIPSYYDGGTVDVNIFWKGGAATGTTVFEISTLGRANNEPWDASLIVLGSKCVNTAGIGSVTTSTVSGKPNWIADELAVVKLRRDGANATDTLVGSANLIMVGVDYKAKK